MKANLTQVPFPNDPRLPVKDKDQKAVRPRDAATIVIYRRADRGGTVEVLMGERHRNHRFMPERYVFPGGRIDRNDSRVRVAEPLRQDVAAKMARTTRPGRARGLALAAVRETFEETGLIIGRPDPAPGARVPEDWAPFFATGYAPSLGAIDYIGRAIAPAFRPIRYDARFFIIDAAEAEGAVSDSAELKNLHWVAINDARKLDLPNATTKILGHVAGFVDSPPATRAATPVYAYVFIGWKQYLREE